VIRDDDTRLALGTLAAAWCARLDVKRIGITGSNGKTTVKEMVAAILRAHAGDTAVHATAGNFNNDIGLPLTLLALRPAHRYAVIEMGMNHFGEIRYLAACPAAGGAGQQRHARIWAAASTAPPISPAPERDL
jgi:UDP-N-acetylmuramoyl-tripeptide--D-alanyl-D-alanine ligase